MTFNPLEHCVPVSLRFLACETWNRRNNAEEWRKETDFLVGALKSYKTYFYLLRLSDFYVWMTPHLYGVCRSCDSPKPNIMMELFHAA